MEITELITKEVLNKFGRNANRLLYPVTLRSSGTDKLRIVTSLPNDSSKHAVLNLECITNEEAVVGKLTVFIGIGDHPICPYFKEGNIGIKTIKRATGTDTLDLRIEFTDSVSIIGFRVEYSPILDGLYSKNVITQLYDTFPDSFSNDSYTPRLILEGPEYGLSINVQVRKKYGTYTETYSGRLMGTITLVAKSETAEQLETPRNFSITVNGVSSSLQIFDGTLDINMSVTIPTGHLSYATENELGGLVSYPLSDTGDDDSVTAFVQVEQSGTHYGYVEVPLTELWTAVRALRASKFIVCDSAENTPSGIEFTPEGGTLIVGELDALNAQTNCTYLVYRSAIGDSFYDEYISIIKNDTYSWELLGTTRIDLSNYYTKGESDSTFKSKQTPISDVLPDGTYTDNVVTSVELNANGEIEVTKKTVTPYTAGKLITVNNHEISSTVPTILNELIYSNDNNTLTTKQLMWSEGLLVDTLADFNLCKLKANVAFSKVYAQTGWTLWGSFQADTDAWGYHKSDGTDLDSNPDYEYNGNPLDYIYNTRNTTYLTGYLSNDLYNLYDYTTAAGIVPAMKRAAETDYMAISPAVYYDDTLSENKFGGISFSLNNTSSTGPLNRESISSTHTISLLVWALDDLNSSNSTAPTTLTIAQLITPEEGITIIPFNSSISNSSDNVENTISSTILTRWQRKGNLITLYASDPYLTTDDDATHSVHIDRPIVIDLDSYIVKYTDIDGVVHTKDFSSNTGVVEVFNKLQGSARIGYEVISNPGSIFRNASSDEIILNLSPDSNYNTTWQFDGIAWQDVTSTIGSPITLISGSRLAYNRITEKLFYSTGTDIKLVSMGTTIDSMNTKILNLQLTASTVDTFMDTVLDTLDEFGATPRSYSINTTSGTFIERNLDLTSRFITKLYADNINTANATYTINSDPSVSISFTNNVAEVNIELLNSDKITWTIPVDNANAGAAVLTIQYHY